jgi:ubiquinone/menaquinone biosynthesis C-methylase UbiE
MALTRSGAVPAWARRAFWSWCGRLVWDAGGSSRSVVDAVVAALRARRAAECERVLDAGCGTGDCVLALARERVAAVGVDFAPGMLAHARAKAAASGAACAFVGATLDARLPFPDGDFDHALCVSALQAVADPAFTLGELRRVLKPGGSLVLVHHPRPALHRFPFGHELRVRAGRLPSPSPAQVALVAAKAWAERRDGAYWSPAELRAMLDAAGYALVSLAEAPSLLAVAERPR